MAGSGGIVVDDGCVLLVRQRRHYGLHWEFPSGYYEAAESFEQAAAREILEETAVLARVGALVCTMVWEREHDRRRNLLAYFLATPVDPAVQPRGQTEEDIEEAAFVDPQILGTGEIHPMHQAILDRWWQSRETGFHLHVDVSVHPDGTQSYAIRS
jgi:8-oxo-dGTP pyrophosphatase MutT (NUDIX family)